MTTLVDKVKSSLSSKRARLGLAAVIAAVGVGGVTFMPACCNQVKNIREIISPISQDEVVNRKYESILAYEETVAYGVFNSAGREAVSGEAALPEDMRRKVEGFKGVEELILNLARKSVIERTEINYDDAREVGKSVEEIQSKIYGEYYLFVDRNNEGLQKARANWVISKAVNYRKLLSSPLRRISEDPTEAYAQMIREVYGTRGAYSERIEKHIEIENALYDALVNANSILSRILAEVLATGTKRETAQRYRASLDEYFPPEE